MQTRNKAQATTTQHQSTGGDQQKKIRPPGNNGSSDAYLSLRNQGRSTGGGINGGFGSGQVGNTASAEDELLQDVMRLTEEGALQNSGMNDPSAQNDKALGQHSSFGNASMDVKNAKKAYAQQLAAATGTLVMSGGVGIGQSNTTPQTATGVDLNKNFKPTNPMSNQSKKPVILQQKQANLIKRPVQQQVMTKGNNSNLQGANFGGISGGGVHHSVSAAQLLGQTQVTILAGTKRSRLDPEEDDDLQSQYSSKFINNGGNGQLYNGGSSNAANGHESKEEDSKVVTMNNTQNKQLRTSSISGANASLQGAAKRLKSVQSQVQAPQAQAQNIRLPSQPGKPDKPKPAAPALKGGLVSTSNQANTLTKKNLEDLDRANHQSANKDQKLFSAAAVSTKADDYDLLSENGKITTEQLLRILLKAHKSHQYSGVYSAADMPQPGLGIGLVQPQDTAGGVSSSINQQQAAASAGKGLKKQQQFAKGGPQTSSQVTGKQVQQPNNQNPRLVAGQTMGGGFHQPQVIEGKQSIESAKKGAAQGNNQGAAKKNTQISHHPQQQSHAPLQPVIYDSNGQLISGQLIAGKDGQVAGYMMDEISAQNAQYHLLNSLSPEVLQLLPQYGNDLVALTQQLIAHGYHNDANSLIAYIELTTPKLTQQQHLQEQGHLMAGGAAAAALQEEEHQRQIQEALYVMIQQQQQQQHNTGVGGQQAIHITPEILQILHQMGISDPSMLSQQSLIDLLVKSGAAATASSGFLAPEYAQLIAGGVGPQNLQMQSAGNLGHLHPYSALAGSSQGPAGFTAAQIANSAQDFQGLMAQHGQLHHQLNMIKPQKFSHVTIAYNIQRKREQEMLEEYAAQKDGGGSIVTLQQQQQMQNPTIIQLVGSANDDAAALAYQQAVDAQLRNQILMSQQQNNDGGMDQQALLAVHVQQKLQEEANKNYNQSIYMQLKTVLMGVAPERLTQVINEINSQQPHLRPFLEQFVMEHQQNQMEMDESSKVLQAAMLAMTGKQSFDQLTHEEIMNCNQVLMQQQQINQRQSIGGTDIAGQQAPNNNGPPPQQSNLDNNSGASVLQGGSSNNLNHQ